MKSLEVFNFRSATLSDIPFLVETVVEAEKAGTDIFPYHTIFGLSLHEAKGYLRLALSEETENCELSLSSYLVAEHAGRPIAAVSAWIEGKGGIASAIVKGNVLGFLIPRDCIKRAEEVSALLGELHIEAVPGSIQIGVSYVSPGYRGFNLIGELINRQITGLRMANQQIEYAFVQVFGNNKPAISAYERIGFEVVLCKDGGNSEIGKFLPGNVKLLMRKDVKTN